MSDLLYGRNAVREALRGGRKIMRLLVAEAAPSTAAPPRPGERIAAQPRGGKSAPGGRGPTGKPGPKGPPGRAGAHTGDQPSYHTRTMPAESRAERRTVTMAGRAPLEAIIALATGKGVPIERVAGQRLDEFTNGANHQGVAAVAAEYHYISWPNLLDRIRSAGPKAVVLLLDSLQDPQNFGTLLRTAEAVGITGVVMPEHRSVGVTPAVCNASSGAVEHLRIARVANLTRVVEELKDENVWVYALAGDEPGAMPYTKADLRGALALVVGSEGHGVGTLIRKRCDGALALPMHGQIESLNAAVAGSIMLYEALRQRTTQQSDAVAASAPAVRLET